jgi:hypothetical protein
MGACVPFEVWNHAIGLFPREGIGSCSCVVLIYSDPFYSSLKVRRKIKIKKEMIQTKTTQVRIKKMIR